MEALHRIGLGLGAGLGFLYTLGLSVRALGETATALLAGLLLLSGTVWAGSQLRRGRPGVLTVCAVAVAVIAGVMLLLGGER